MTENQTHLLLRVGAWIAVFGASLLNLLGHNAYPLWSPEIAILLVAIILLGAVLGWIHNVARPRLSFLFTGLLVYLAIDLNSENMTIAIIAGVAASAIAFKWDAVLLKLSAAGFTTSFVFQAVTGLLFAGPAIVSAQAAPALHSQSELPPIVHILLDSYLGTEGMAADPSGFGELRDDNIAFWQTRGFRLYDGAYSRHANTANSVRHALSFGEHPLATTTQKLQHIVPERLEYFEHLQARGYSIHAVLPDFIDLCEKQPIDDCEKFRRSDLSSITRYDLSTADRVRTIGTTLVGMSHLAGSVYVTLWNGAIKLGLAEPGRLYDDTKLFPLASADALDDFENKLADAQPGNAYFAHLLLPHDPYAFDAECRVKPKSQWLSEGGPPGDLAARDAAYREQMRCTMKRLDGLLTTLDSSQAGRGAIVIIHGDHGSRIVGQRPFSDIANHTPRDLAMTYSTLFAVRAPGIQPQLVAGRAAIEDLLGALVSADFAAAPKTSANAAKIMLADEEWVPRRSIKLPEYAPALTKN